MFASMFATSLRGTFASSSQITGTTNPAVLGRIGSAYLCETRRTGILECRCGSMIFGCRNHGAFLQANVP